MFLHNQLINSYSIPVNKISSIAKYISHTLTTKASVEIIDPYI